MWGERDGLLYNLALTLVLGFMSVFGLCYYGHKLLVGDDTASCIVVVPILIPGLILSWMRARTTIKKGRGVFAYLSFSFSRAGVNTGEILLLVPSMEKVCVVNDRQVEYHGKRYSLAKFFREHKDTTLSEVPFYECLHFYLSESRHQYLSNLCGL